MNKILFAFSAAICVILTGCATPPVPMAPTPVDPAAMLLDKAIAKAPAGTAAAGPEARPQAPVYGEAKNTVSFLGDANTLLAQVAKGLGPDWKFMATGPAPRLPIYVQVHVSDVELKRLLSEVALQLSQRADVVLNHATKVIELRYRANV